MKGTATHGAAMLAAGLAAHVYRRWRRTRSMSVARERFNGPTDNWKPQDWADYQRHEKRAEALMEARHRANASLTLLTFGLYQPECLSVP